MRVVLGLLGVLVSLPPVVLFSVLSSTLTRPQERTVVRVLRLVTAACLLVSAGSVVAPPLGRPNLWALAVVGLVYLGVALVVWHHERRRSGRNAARPP